MAGGSVRAVGAGSVLGAGGTAFGCAAGSTFGDGDGGAGTGVSVDRVVTKTSVRNAGPGPPANDVATKSRAATAVERVAAVRQRMPPRRRRYRAVDALPLQPRQLDVPRRISSVSSLSSM